MHIIVCLKQIIDPETPAEDFRVDPAARRAILPQDRGYVISDYDANALEGALRLKDRGDSKVTVFSLGEERTKEALRKALGMGADEAILLSDPLYDDADSFAVAHVLSQAIKKADPFDLILCGRQEGDWDAGQVGSGMAELLGLPSATCVGGIEVQDGSIIVERIVADGRETIELPLPAVLTISSEIGVPRYAPLKGVMAAFEKNIPVWNAEVIPPAESRNRMLDLFIPVRKEEECLFIEGDTPEEAGINLALRLRNAKLI
ncbi:MAG: electron transfer flavoprotein subunit beta/FixA family protein [Deltaproteobacteria bacterium]|nr:electron transfer flavoprotein subunit beta/FixA family protein [Deltaproteobacteria bacterium]